MAAALDPWADVEGEGRAKPIPGGVDLARHRGFDCGAVFIWAGIKLVPLFSQSHSPKTIFSDSTIETI